MAGTLQPKHEAIHQEGGAGQVAGIFHQRQQQIEEKDDRQKAGDGADPEPDAIEQEAPQQGRGADALQEWFQQPLANAVEQQAEALLQRCPQAVDRLEHHRHDQQEEQRPHEGMEQQAIDPAAVAVAGVGGLAHAGGGQLQAQGLQRRRIGGRGRRRWRAGGGRVDRLEQGADPLATQGTDRHHRQRQAPGQAGGVDPHAPAAGLIAHVQGHHRGQTEGAHLQQQAQLGHHLGGVEHHHHQIGRCGLQEALHDRLVFAAAAEVVDAG